MFESIMGKKKDEKKIEKAPATDCPLNRESLGTATWGLLHTMGRVYPKKPTPEYQAKTKAFIETLALLYPCSHCAPDFQKEIEKSPPRVDSRTSLSLWLCEQHNIVSKKLNKPQFECTMKNLDEHWGNGRPACWDDDEDN